MTKMSALLTWLESVTTTAHGGGGGADGDGQRR